MSLIQHTDELPEFIESETELDDVLTRPSAALARFIPTVSSPLVVLGAGGKMGPTLAVLARRAADLAGHPLNVIAVSRFSDESSRRWLESRGVTTISADLLDRRAVHDLPDASDLIYLVGLKFGTRADPARTWAVNTLVPAHVAERYPAARLVALSTGNVYPFTDITGDGAREDHALTPIGEYANAAIARERLFEYFSHKNGTPIALLRLSYAVDLRYGVLRDIAQKVYAGEPIDVTPGSFNCLWQGDANDMIVRALQLATSPARAFNLTGSSAVSVRDAATQFAQHLGRPLTLVGSEASTALLSNTGRLRQEFGSPVTTLETMIRWTAHWVKAGGRTLNKPTHFEVRDGAY